MLIYGKKYRFDIFCVSDIFRMMIINEGATIVIPADDSSNFSLGLFPLTGQSSGISTAGLDYKPCVGFAPQSAVWIRVSDQHQQ